MELLIGSRLESQPSEQISPSTSRHPTTRDDEPLLKIGVLVRIRRSTAAQKPHSFLRGNLMPRSCRNEDRISRDHRLFFTVNFDLALTNEHVVKLLTQPVIMTLRLTTCHQAGLSQTLLFHRSIAQIKQASDRRSVLRRQGLLFCVFSDDHSPEESSNPGREQCPQFHGIVLRK